MKRIPFLIACLASALSIGGALTAAAQTGGYGSGTNNGTTGTGTTSGQTGTNQTGTTGTSGTYDRGTSYGTTGTTTTGRVRVGSPYTGPDLTFTGTPDVVVVPGTDIYYISNSDYDLYRSGSNWYYRYNGRWYRGTNYTGPFTYVTTTTVPRGIRTVPTKYRHHWTTTASTETNMGGTSMAGDETYGGTMGTTRHHAKSKLHSRHKARTTRYSKTTHRRHHARTHTASTMGRPGPIGRESTVTGAHSEMESQGGNDMDQTTTENHGVGGTTTGGYGSETGSMSHGRMAAGQPYSGPAITFTRQPTIATIPGTQVSYLRDSNYDMYRYGSDWYMNSDGTWYRATNYSGPYVSVEVSSVPRPIMSVPTRFRHHW